MANTFQVDVVSAEEAIFEGEAEFDAFYEDTDYSLDYFMTVTGFPM